MGEVPRDSSSSTPNSTTDKPREGGRCRQLSFCLCLCSSLSVFVDHAHSTLRFFSFVLWIDLSEWSLACIFWRPCLPFLLERFLAGRSETHLYQIKPFACVGEWLLRCDTLQCFCNFLVCINYSELQFQNYQITWKQKRFGRLRVMCFNGKETTSDHWCF